MKDIVIIGAGGFGREVEWLINRINEKYSTYNIIGFIDDNEELLDKEIGHSKVICNIEQLSKRNKKTCVAIAIGNTVIRKKIYDRLKNNKNLDFPNLIDPSVIVGETELGIGNIICANTVMTVNVKIKNFSIINLDCTIGHDDIFDDFVTLYPSVNVSGGVHIGKCSEIGTGTQIIQQHNIINNVIVGAGAVVVKDIEESGTYIGVPAKKI